MLQEFVDSKWLLYIVVGGVVGIMVGRASAWVYRDATKYGIGKIEGRKDRYNMSAGAWAVLVLLTMGTGISIYLSKRKKLKELAESRPVVPQGRQLKTRLILLAGISIGALSGVMKLNQTIEHLTESSSEAVLPTCDAAWVRVTAERVVRESPEFKRSGRKYVKLRGMLQNSYDPLEERRVCRGLLTTNMEKGPVLVTLRWKTKSKRDVVVRVAPIPVAEQPSDS